MSKKPIRIFFGTLSRRYSASDAYRVDAKKGVVTGEIFRPIDQAPQDGTLVLVLTWDEENGWEHASLGRFERDPLIVSRGKPAWVCDTTGNELEPTHFLYLPAAAHADG